MAERSRAPAPFFGLCGAFSLFRISGKIFSGLEGEWEEESGTRNLRGKEAGDGEETGGCESSWSGGNGRDEELRQAEVVGEEVTQSGGDWLDSTRIWLDSTQKC